MNVMVLARMDVAAAMTNCPYCDPDIMKPINYEGVHYCGIEVVIMPAIPQMRVRYGYEPEWTKYCRDSAQDVMGINFCPICGKNLKIRNLAKSQ